MKTLITYTKPYSRTNLPISLKHTARKHAQAINELLTLVETGQVSEKVVDFTKMKNTIQAITEMKEIKRTRIVNELPVEDVIYYPADEITEQYDFMIITK